MAVTTRDLARITVDTPQRRLDVAVPWRGVADFATRCAFSGIELHLFADGDHRLTDRKERLWDLMAEFLRGRGLTKSPHRTTLAGKNTF